MNSKSKYRCFLMFISFSLVFSTTVLSQETKIDRKPCAACKGEGTLQKTIEIPVEKNCNVCNGGPGHSICGTCSGSGIIHKSKARRIIGIKYGTKRWTETCSSCGGQGRFYCSGNCNKGKKIFKTQQTKTFPCDNEKCPGGKKERELYEKTKKKLDSVRKNLDQIQIYLKDLEKEKRLQKSLVEVICRNAKSALIDKEWNRFVDEYGRNNIINITGEKLFELYAHINEQIKDIPIEQVREIVEQYEKR